MSKQIDKYAYNPHDIIGTGSTGNVYKGVEKKTNKVVALKQIPKSFIKDDEALKQALIDEIQVIQKIVHPKVVQLIEVLSSDNNYYVVQEFCKTDLQQHLKLHHKLPESEVISLLKDILEGYTELIKNGVIHRGIKLTNIMVTDNGYKLTDCGIAKCLENFRKDNKQLENFLFSSPEVLLNQKYTSKCDIWSIGMVLYHCIYGYTPWFGRTAEDFLRNIQNSMLDFPDSQVKVSNELKSLMEGCLQTDEHHRFGFDQLFDHKLLADHFKAYKNQIKDDQIKYLMTEIRLKIIKQNLDITELFKKFDVDGNNDLEYKEFRQLLLKIDPSITNYDTQIIFKKLDLDGNKNISFEEFAKWLTNNNTKMTLLTGKFRGGQRKSMKQTDNQPKHQGQNQQPIQFFDPNPVAPLAAVPQQPQYPNPQFNPMIGGGPPINPMIPNTYSPPPPPPPQMMGTWQSPNQSQGMNSMERIILGLKRTIMASQENLYDIFMRADQDRDSMLNFQEFSTMIFKLNNTLTQSDLWSIFKIFDINEDQHISFIEMRQVFNLAVDKSMSMIQSAMPQQFNSQLWGNHQQPHMDHAQYPSPIGFQGPPQTPPQQNQYPQFNQPIYQPYMGQTFPQQPVPHNQLFPQGNQYPAPQQAYSPVLQQNRQSDKTIDRKGMAQFNYIPDNIAQYEYQLPNHQQSGKDIAFMLTHQQ